MAFPRARLKRFNEMHEKTPGVGSYNLAQDKPARDKAGSLARFNETLKNCRDKALTAAEKGALPKHVEEIHAKLAHAQERVLDLEILKIGWDKQRELTEKEKGELRQQLAQLEVIRERLTKSEKERQEQSEQIKALQLLNKELGEQMQKLQLNVTEAERRNEGLEKEKALLTSELAAVKESETEIERVAELQRDEITNLKQSLTEAQNEFRAVKKESELLAARQEKESGELKLRLSMVEEAHLKLGTESADIAEDLTKKLILCENENSRLESENAKQASRLEEVLGEVEELTQHVLFAQEKQRESAKEAESMKQSHEKELKEFENEKEFLTSQIQSLIIRCEDDEDKLKRRSEMNAVKYEAVRNENNQKLCEIEEKNKQLEDIVSDIERDRKEMLSREHHLKEKLIALENAQMCLESESSALTQELSNQLLSHSQKIGELEVENDNLAQKLERALEKAEVIETSSKLALEDAKTSYCERLAKLEKDSVESHKKQEAVWTNKLSAVEEEKSKLTSELCSAKAEITKLKNDSVESHQKQETSWTNKLSAVEEEKKQLVSEVCLAKEEIAKLESDSVESHRKQETVWTNKLSAAEDDKKQLASEVCLAKEEIERLKNSSVELCQKQETMWTNKLSEVEGEKKQLQSEVFAAKEQILQCGQEIDQLQSKCDEILAENENLAHNLTQLEEELKSVAQKPVIAAHDREDYEDRLASADHEIEGLTNIIAEMSEKIEQFECDRAEILAELKDSKARCDDLEKRMEPFKDILNGFELERQLLHDKDKFTDEQLEKLRQECIKNMGHQNHKQRINYLNKTKEENLSLSKKVHELQLQNLRHEDTIKKLKGKRADENDSSRMPCQRTPLKEGNRL